MSTSFSHTIEWEGNDLTVSIGGVTFLEDYPEKPYRVGFSDGSRASEVVASLDELKKFRTFLDKVIQFEEN